MTHDEQTPVRPCEAGPRPWQPYYWGMWIGLGGAMGAVVVGGLVFVIGYLSTTGSESARGFVGAVALVAGVLGSVGGAIAGGFSAAITGELDRHRGLTAIGFAAVAGTVTLCLAGAVAILLALQSGDVFGQSTLVSVWMPTAACGATAAATGWCIWGWTHRPWRV